MCWWNKNNWEKCEYGMVVASSLHFLGAKRHVSWIPIFTAKANSFFDINHFICPYTVILPLSLSLPPILPLSPRASKQSAFSSSLLSRYTPSFSIWILLKLMVFGSSLLSLFYLFGRRGGRIVQLPLDIIPLSLYSHRNLFVPLFNALHHI